MIGHQEQPLLWGNPVSHTGVGDERTESSEGHRRSSCADTAVVQTSAANLPCEEFVYMMDLFTEGQQSTDEFPSSQLCLLPDLERPGWLQQQSYHPAWPLWGSAGLELGLASLLLWCS